MDVSLPKLADCCHNVHHQPARPSVGPMNLIKNKTAVMVVPPPTKGGGTIYLVGGACAPTTDHISFFVS